MEQDAELVELETVPGAGVTGIRVARDRHGLYVATAPKSLRVRQGDRLVGARIFFEGTPPEDVERVLEGAGGCKVSLCVRRRSILIPTPSKKPPAAPGVALATPPSAVAVELALPKLPKLVKSRSGAEPAPMAAPEPRRPHATPARLTVKEAAAGKTRAMEELPAKAEGPSVTTEVPAGPGAWLPAVEVAAPKVTVGVSLGGAAPPAAPQTKEPALRLPQLEVAVPALPRLVAVTDAGVTVKQPQTEPGEGGSPGSRRRDGASPVLKTKLPSFGMGAVDGEKGDGGTRGGFASIRVPSITIAVPSATVELVSELGVPKAEPTVAGGQPRLEVKALAQRPESPPVAPARLSFPTPAVPSIDITVPRVGVDLALPEGAGTAAVPDEGDTMVMPDVAARFAKGLRKLSLELESAAPLPAVEIATPALLAGDVPATGAKPKAPKFTLPRFGLSLAKLKMGGDSNGHPPASPSPAVPAPPSIAISSPTVALDLALGTAGTAGGGVKLKVPKLSLGPFGDKDGDKGGGWEEGPQDTGAVAKVPWLGIGGSAEDDRGSGVPRSPGTTRFRVPQVGITMPAPGSRRVPSLPKLPIGTELGRGVKLPKFGGSSPDIRTEGGPKTLRRGGSAESLSIGTAGRKMPESPGTIQPKPKTRGAMGDRRVPPSSPRFTIPAVGFTMPVKPPEDAGSWKILKPTGMPALNVPVLELAPPGMDGMEETARKAAENQLRVKLPKFGANFAGSGREGEGRMKIGSVKKVVAVLVKPKEKGEAKGVAEPHPHVNGEAEGKARRRRWVPRVGFSPGGSPPEPPIAQPKAGKMWLPDVELSPKFDQQPVMTEVTPRFSLGGFRGEGTPRFQLPKVALSPQVLQ